MPKPTGCAAERCRKRAYYRCLTCDAEVCRRHRVKRYSLRRTADDPNPHFYSCVDCYGSETTVPS